MRFTSKRRKGPCALDTFCRVGGIVVSLFFLNVVVVCGLSVFTIPRRLVDTDVKQVLGEYIRSRGGRIHGNQLAEFYKLHPQSRSVIGGKLSKFCNTHYEFKLDKLSGYLSFEENSGERTVVVNDRRSMSPAKLSITQPIAVEVKQLLGHFIKSRGGLLHTGQISDFYNLYPHAKKAIGKLSKFCKSYNDVAFDGISNTVIFVGTACEDSTEAHDSKFEIPVNQAKEKKIKQISGDMLQGRSFVEDDTLGTLKSVLQSARSIDNNEEWIEFVIKEMLPTSADVRGVNDCRVTLEQLARADDPDFKWKASIFGSSANGFGARGCDIDAVLHAKLATSCSKSKQVMLLKKIHRALQRHPEFYVLECIYNANVPILKLRFRGKRDVDLSVANVLALENTRLLQAYANMDNHIRDLGLIIKLWGKALGDPRFVTPYALTLMMIYFLQVDENIQLPCLQEGGGVFGNSDGFIDASVKSALAEPMMKLATRFFRFYAEDFAWGSEMISIRIGRRLTIEDPCFHSLMHACLEKLGLHIEDPFIQAKSKLGARKAKACRFRLAIQQTWTRLSQADRSALFPLMAS